MNGLLNQLLLFVHIVLAVIWVGSILFIGWGVYPASNSLKPQFRQTFLKSLMQHTHRLFSLTGASVIVTGVLLGTVFGPIHDWASIVETSYGRSWLTALIVALFTLFWGIFIGYQKSMQMLSNDAIWIDAENGNSYPLKKAMTHTVMIESVEGAGFMIIIICMVLL